MPKGVDELSPLQCEIAFQKGTEKPFSGEYVDHHEDGTYHCVVCDNELFSSSDKFDSGTGWPSFSEVVEEGKVKTQVDDSQGMQRTEVVCAQCGAHLGHLFDDGPDPTGQRYCINSAVLEFEKKKDS